MKKLLILTYYFPPLGLGGTQRIAKFVKYLPQFGWQPTIITVKPIAYWALDDSLMQDVKEARIIRTESMDPQRLMARLGKGTIKPSVEGKRSGIAGAINQKVLPFLLTPDSKILWRHYALKAAKHLLSQESFDALLTTSPPHSVHLIGRKIAQKYNLKWLTDFRDGWAGSHVVHEPTRAHFAKNKRLQRRVTESADAVTCISSAIKKTLTADGANEKFHIIPNGYDPQDFEAVAGQDRRGFTLCYSGTINQFADPEPFLDALVLLKQNNPDEYKKLNVQFVGFDTFGNFENMIQRRGLDRLEIVGHKPHSQSVTYLKNADALLLIAKARPTDTFIPGKTFEYFGAQKPIFAISNSAPTNTLLENAAQATVVASFQSTDIYVRLRDFLSDKTLSKKIDKKFIKQFDRCEQTKQLSEILNSITQRS
jgi:glycosyltransferase involved in cell wall biosynthesis